MPAKTQTKLSQKIEKQIIKLNKNIFIAKTLMLLPIRQNLIPIYVHFSKVCSKPIFDSQIAAVLYLQRLKKFIGP